ncbi:MAG: hypothetical protein LBE74_09960 [Treponema sp.]|jgi:hypothetical protein|nr:hypothetical protein [Treponema sp.]
MMDITAGYDREEFIDFLRDRFLPDDFETAATDVNIDKKNALITIATRLGVCASMDLSVYEFRRTYTRNPRVILSREAFSILERYDKTASDALAVFYNEDR